MAVKLRLRRTGKRNAPAHRLVATESAKARDGRFIETLGFYDPRREREELNVDRVNYWLSNGAQPSATAARIIKRAQARASQQEQQEVSAGQEEQAGENSS